MDHGTAAWARLYLAPELGRYRRAGVRPRLWWRDDDAARPTAALDRLLGLAGARPLALAVVPSGDLPALARRLSAAPKVVAGQHGVDHVNRAEPGRPPTEYPAGSSAADAAARLAEARAALVAAGLAPAFYTPPWNRMPDGAVDRVAEAGFAVLSAGAERPSGWDGAYWSAEVDVLRWSDGPRFRGRRKVLSALGAALAARRRAGALDRPIGLLTHHLDHDAATWDFLAGLLPRLDRHVEWVSVADAA